MSNDVAYLENILTHQANTSFLYGCHNFYPQEGTGLPYHFFQSSSERFKKTVFERQPSLPHNQVESDHGISMMDCLL